ncbi:MAG: hypothetical protein JRI72_00010 [Deltaproteobacteria bacterium]|nr:hypothetical protein [Deltaproteobacteria bacterium]
MRNKNHFRQGDVGITKTNKKFDSKKMKKVKPVNNRVILAYGEATGHHHSIALADYPETELFEIVGEAEKLLKVAEPGTKITHQEHGAIWLSPGWYEIHHQVEYDPEGERRVMD